MLLLDAFLILLGILIIVAAFAQSIMEKTSLSKIGSELEVDREEVLNQMMILRK